MKTKDFGTINIVETEEGMCILTVCTPSEGCVNLEMSADEVLLFLMSMCNKLHDARARELANQVAKDLEREKRKV